MPTPPHHLNRPGASETIDRLAALIETLGGRKPLYEMVGGIDEFGRLVATSKQLTTYLASQRSLPKEETSHRIRAFLDIVEPAVATGIEINPKALRAALQADIDARAARAAASVRRYR